MSEVRHVVLDACVLIPMPLADTLLRLAEAEALYQPLWSREILEETGRNLRLKFGLAPWQVERREQQMLKYFPAAMVTGYEPLVSKMRNHPKDRHVLAAAVHAKAELIVTFNAKDFPTELLQGFGVKRLGPSAFLRELYDRSPSRVMHVLREQADAIPRPLVELLRALARNVPTFVEHVCEREGITLAG